MTSNRSIVGLGIANALIIVSFLSQRHITSTLVERLVISILWTIILLIIGLQLVKHFDLISIKYMVPVSIISGVITYYLLDLKNKKEIISILAGISFFTGSWFNPMVVNGTSIIYENEISKQLLDIDKSHNEKTNWLIYSDWVTPNLFRMIGVKAVNGTHHYPQFSFWKILDEEGTYYSEYNRYAQVMFEPSENEKPVIHSPSPDQIMVSVNPCSNILEKLEITHVMVKGKNFQLFDDCKKLQQIYNNNGVQLYKVLF